MGGKNNYYSQSIDQSSFITDANHMISAMMQPPFNPQNPSFQNQNYFGLNTNNPTLPNFQSSSDPSAIGVSGGGLSVPSYYQSYLTQQ